MCCCMNEPTKRKQESENQTPTLPPGNTERNQKLHRTNKELTLNYFSPLRCLASDLQLQF
jgi:hypothetical protein